MLKNYHCLHKMKIKLCNKKILKLGKIFNKDLKALKQWGIVTITMSQIKMKIIIKFILKIIMNKMKSKKS